MQRQVKESMKHVASMGVEAARSAKEQHLRREVFNAIVALSDTLVDEVVLQKTLGCLDQNSWMEVIEERYLSRLCGFPLCANPVEIKPSRKFRIDLKNKKVFEQSTEKDKFCCQNCFLRSAALRAQLEVEPLWIRGDEHKKIFDLSNKSSEQGEKNVVDVGFINKKRLVTSFDHLKIIDIGGSENAGDAGKEHDKTVSNAHELHDCCWYLQKQKSGKSSPMQKSAKPLSNETANDTFPKIKLNSKLSDDEKLVLIRSKYSLMRSKRAPIMIEAKPLTLVNEDKFSNNFYENFERIFSEWCGPETIHFFRYCNKIDLLGKITDAARITLQFYAGDQLLLKELQTKDHFLPPVDNVDQAKQRILVLTDLLKPSWQLLEAKLGVDGCAQRALQVISTFRLSATNTFLCRNDCHLAVAVIFRLLSYCDSSLMDSYRSKKLVSYLEEIRCSLKRYNQILSIVMNELG